MMKCKCEGDEIRLCYKEDIDRIRTQYHHELSSHAFASLYLWRKQMKLTLYLEEDMFAVKSRWRGKNTWFFPCGNESSILDFLEKHKKEDFAICYARKQDIQLIERHFPNEFSFFLDEASSEYIYEKEEHRILYGKNYANLRTQIHKVEKEHSLRTALLTEETLADAFDVIRNWSKKELKISDNVLKLGDGEIDEEALQLFQELDISGVVVYMNEEPYAIAAGYPLSENTYDLFLAKEKERISGLAYYTKREFFLSLPQNYQYINIEEDLGIEGLRRMKKNLNPIYMNEIWEAIRCQK